MDSELKVGYEHGIMEIGHLMLMDVDGRVIHDMSEMTVVMSSHVIVEIILTIRTVQIQMCKQMSQQLVIGSVIMEVIELDDVCRQLMSVTEVSQVGQH